MTDNAKRNLGKIILYVLFVLVLLGTDQYTKRLAAVHLKGGEDFVLIKNILSFSYLENTGAAWGVLSGKTILFIVVTCILAVFILAVMCRLEVMKKEAGRKVYTVMQVDLAVLIAGAFGNLVDRIVNGYVVDFIKTDFINFPVFSVADCYVTISMILLIIILLCFVKEDELDRIFFLKGKRAEARAGYQPPAGDREEKSKGE